MSGSLIFSEMTPKQIENALANIRIEVPQMAFPEVEPIGVPHVLTGEAAFAALREAVEELQKLAPKDHDVVISAYGMRVLAVTYKEPHTFLFRGVDQNGNENFVIIHFSQLVAHVVYLPKRGENRVITGFSKA